MSNITFAVLTYNEEKRISHVIKNLRNYGDVIILDGGSSDNTREISESLGARFYLRPTNTKPYVETKENFEFLKEVTDNDWIYWGYADNILSKGLLDKLLDIAKQDIIKIVFAPLYTYLWGNTKNYSNKGYIPVLYHRNYVNFDKEHIHGMGNFIGVKKEQLKLPNKEKYSVKHFSVYNSNKFINGQLKYSEVEAFEKHQSGKKFSLIRMLAAMIRYIWIYYRSGHKNGSLGVIVALHYSFSRLMTYTKLYEIENNITLESINKNYDDMVKKMVREFE